MSLYDKAEPFKVQEYREKTAKGSSMVGVAYPVKRCSQCDEHKSLIGSTRIAGKFICAGCRVPAVIGA